MSTADDSYDYDGKVFASTVTADTAGIGGGGPIGRYHQRGDLVWAEFAGGKVRHGSLVGVRDADGRLRLAYCQVLEDGTVICGDCISTPERLADGRIRLREVWRRYSPRAEDGVSVIDEVRTPQPTL
jgi:hypothetical protein